MQILQGVCKLLSTTVDFIAMSGWINLFRLFDHSKMSVFQSFFKSRFLSKYKQTAVIKWWNHWQSINNSDFKIKFCIMKKISKVPQTFALSVHISALLHCHIVCCFYVLLLLLFFLSRCCGSCLSYARLVFCHAPLLLWIRCAGWG